MLDLGLIGLRMNAIGRAGIHTEMILDAVISNYVRHIIAIPFLTFKPSLGPIAGARCDIDHDPVFKAVTFQV